jgi:hypothetical protein
MGGRMEGHMPLHPIEIYLGKLCKFHYWDAALELLCEAAAIVVTT